MWWVHENMTRSRTPHKLCIDVYVKDRIISCLNSCEKKHLKWNVLNVVNDQDGMVVTQCNVCSKEKNVREERKQLKEKKG